MAQSWEYKVLVAWHDRDGKLLARDSDVDPANPRRGETLQSRLDELGVQGFELAAALPLPIPGAEHTFMQHVYTLKREARAATSNPHP